MKLIGVVVICFGMVLSSCTLSQVADVLDKTATVVDTATAVVVTTQSMFEKGYKVGQNGKIYRLDKDVSAEEFDTAIKTVLSRYNFSGLSRRIDTTLELQDLGKDGEILGIKHYTAYGQEFYDTSSMNAPGGVLCRIIYKKPMANAFYIALAVGMETSIEQNAAHERARELVQMFSSLIASELNANLY